MISLRPRQSSDESLTDFIHRVIDPMMMRELTRTEREIEAMFISGAFRNELSIVRKTNWLGEWWDYVA